jgi:hypothetical protein
VFFLGGGDSCRGYKQPRGGFRLQREVRLLRNVLCEAWGFYEFEVCGLRVEDGRVSFYINAVAEVVVILLNRGQLSQKPFRFRKI